MDFITSKIELKRRKIAFLVLSISMIAGVFIASFALNYTVSSAGYLVPVLALFIIGVLSFKFLGNISHLKIRVSGAHIQRITPKSSESYPLSDVSRIKIKRRSSGGIREIYLYFKGRKNLSITAQEEHFERLIKTLLSKTGKNVEVKEVREPINFDHPLFYPILGLAIGFIGVFCTKYAAKMDFVVAKAFIYGFSAYLLAMATYFYLAKPISSRSGQKHAFVDSLVGLTMIAAAAAVFVTGQTL